MNGFVFTNPGLLAGLALLAVPILIHLLLRIKKKRLRFSTIQFFLRQDEQATRRRKLRNWLLLAVRTLILLLIVVAFARPYLTRNPPGGKAAPQKQVVLVVDRSASMLAMDPEGQRWPRAKAAMQKVLSQLGPGDRAALIACTDRAEVLAGPGAARDVLPAIDTLKPTHGAADLGKGLQLATRLLAKSSSPFTNSICVISDLQRTSCPNLGSYPIPRDASLEVLNVGDPYAPNVAVTELLLKTTRDGKPTATLVNFSEDDFPSLSLKLLLDGKEVSSAPLHLAGGSSTNIELVLPPTGPGWHSAETRIQARDAQPLDDVRDETFYVPPPVRLLVAEPRQVPRLFQEESFLLIAALDPAFGTTNTMGSPFALEKISIADLMDRLQRNNSPSPYDVVVLPGLKSVTAGMSVALREFVTSGGGLLLFLNDSISVNRYNAEFADVLPAALEKIETASDYDWRLWEHEEHSPVFAPFAAPNSGNLALSRFIRRAALHPAEHATVLAHFQDGVPLMIERGLGKGRVVLVNTSADTGWSDWPKHRTFVPWVHSLTRFLANRSPVKLPGAEQALLAGARTELDLGSEHKNCSLTVVRPDRSESLSNTDTEGTILDLELLTAGVYSVRTAQGQELSRWAVDVPAAESDLVAMSASEFERQIVRMEPSHDDQSPAAALFGAHDGRHEFWPLLLLCGLILLLLEVLLANRTLA